MVWTYWTTSGANNLSASVKDFYGNGVGSPPFYSSAVGPTVQSAASSPTAAQIFYAKDTTSGSGGDVVTVTYSGSASTSGCVVVEYQGADRNYPLDSVSAGYGYNAGTLLDSGTAAPANANLLVFGGGTTDAPNLGNVSAGSGFTSIVANFSSITEQYITTSPNNTLCGVAECTLSTGSHAILARWMWPDWLRFLPGPPLEMVTVCNPRNTTPQQR